VGPAPGGARARPAPNGLQGNISSIDEIILKLFIFSLKI
jgi:hypothetical protein